MIVQKLGVTKNEFLIAEKYYGILSVINDLKLTEREIQLVAFTAIKGNISNANVREEFCKKYNTSSATINNIISKLKKFGMFIINIFIPNISFNIKFFRLSRIFAIIKYIPTKEMFANR
jgi:hypothetical protein